MIVYDLRSEALGVLAQGVLFMAAGAAILLNLDDVGRFAQRAGVKRDAWLRKQLGDSFLTRRIWFNKNPRSLPNSRISYFGLGLFLFLSGLALQIFSLWLLLPLKGLLHAP